MTPEDLAKIEARAMNMCGGMHISLCAQELAQDSLALAAALKEAWAENEQWREALLSAWTTMLLAQGMRSGQAKINAKVRMEIAETEIRRIAALAGEKP